MLWLRYWIYIELGIIIVVATYFGIMYALLVMILLGGLRVALNWNTFINMLRRIETQIYGQPMEYWRAKGEGRPKIKWVLKSTKKSKKI